MPDLLSHILVVLIACELINFKKKGLILFGAILPDIVTKIFILGLFIHVPREFIGLLILFHSPFVLFFLVILIGLLFKDFVFAVYLIGIGAISHIILDCFNANYLGGMMLLFPFSWNLYRISLIWPDQYPFLAVPLLLMYIIIKIYNHYTKKILV
jgi:hypothetical protein